MKLMSAFLAILGLAPSLGLAGPRPLPDPIIMMWQVTGPNFAADFPTLAVQGVNLVQSFALSRETPEYVDAYLKAATESGIGVVPALRTHIENRAGECVLSAQGVAFVRRYAGSSAIAAWHSVDEPANHKVSRECQRQIYRHLKALDPDRPVLVSINFTKQEQYDQYFAEDAFDLLDLHKYVNPEVGASQKRLLDLFRSNRKRSYPVIVTLRAFDAPRKIKRVDMRPGDLQAQYRYFFESEPLTANVGFYGWQLAPNKGINQIAWLRDEFAALMRDKIVRRK